MTWPSDKTRKDIIEQLRQLYRAEPIRPRVAEKTVELPPPLVALRKMAKTFKQEDRYVSRDEIFVRQAELAKEYEDDYRWDQTEIRFLPTYESLKDHELRGYFGWRTRLRHGTMEKTSLVYARIYTYEIINQIDVKTPGEGLQKLVAFLKAYEKLDARITENWADLVRDYILYYELDPKMLPPTEFSLQDRAYLVLDDEENASDQEIFQALQKFSTYRMDRSKFYKDNPERYVALMAIAYRQLTEYFLRRRQRTFAEEYIGELESHWMSIFSLAVFYKGRDRRFYSVQATPACTYVNEGGEWLLERVVYFEKAHRKLGKLMKTMEAEFRKFLGFAEIQRPYSYKWMLKLAAQSFEIWQAEENRKKRAQVNLDQSILDKIRAEAAITRDRLITEADLGEEAPPALQEPSVQPPSAATLATDDPVAPMPADTPKPAPELSATAAPAPANLPWQLTPDELHYLQDIVTGNASPWLAQQGLMAAILVDSINAKALEEIGDNILAGDPPALIEDYADDVRQVLAGAAQANPAAAPQSAPWQLTPDELRYLQDILHHAPTDWVQAQGLMASVLCDSINEKLYDDFGDTVLSGDPPEVLEDYIDEVKEGLKS